MTSVSIFKNLQSAFKLKGKKDFDEHGESKREEIESSEYQSKFTPPAASNLKGPRIANNSSQTSNRNNSDINVHRKLSVTNTKVLKTGNQIIEEIEKRQKKNQIFFCLIVSWIFYILVNFTTFCAHFALKFSLYSIGQLDKNIRLLCTTSELKTVVITMISVLVFTTLSHQLATGLLQLYIRIFLSRSFLRNGIYDICIEWVSYRGFINLNQIVIHNLVWRNPATHTKTPYLLYVKELTVSFSLLDFISFTRSGRLKSLKFGEITIDTIDIFFERADTPCSRNSLNLWAAMGIKNKDAEKTLLKSLIDAIMTAIRRRLKQNFASVFGIRGDNSAVFADDDDDDDYNERNDLTRSRTKSSSDLLSEELQSNKTNSKISGGGQELKRSSSDGDLLNQSRRKCIATSGKASATASTNSICETTNAAATSSEFMSAGCCPGNPLYAAASITKNGEVRVDACSPQAAATSPAAAESLLVPAAVQEKKSLNKCGFIDGFMKKLFNNDNDNSNEDNGYESEQLSARTDNSSTEPLADKVSGMDKTPEKAVSDTIPTSLELSNNITTAAAASVTLHSATPIKDEPFTNMFRRASVQVMKAMKLEPSNLSEPFQQPPPAASKAKTKMKRKTSVMTRNEEVGEEEPGQPTVEFSRLIILNLRAYPLDLLSKTHMKQPENTTLPIRVAIFHQTRKDVTGRPRSEGGDRVALPAETFGDRCDE